MRPISRNHPIVVANRSSRLMGLSSGRPTVRAGTRSEHCSARSVSTPIPLATKGGSDGIGHRDSDFVGRVAMR